ncbi:MAG TPA: glucuronate isomerase [Bacillota bacterium]|nr:glucuronate isomerase [Bacillota bacterium]
MEPIQLGNLSSVVKEICKATPVTDIHTHLFPSSFGALHLWGIDELLNYHYLIPETIRAANIASKDYFALTPKDRADLTWRTLFLESNPYSDSCRGVVKILSELNLDLSRKAIDTYRDYFSSLNPAQHVQHVLKLSNVKAIVMSNDPFDPSERSIWKQKPHIDPTFYSSLRLDALVNSWSEASTLLQGWGYDISGEFSNKTESEVRRFILDWIELTQPLFLSISLPPDFSFPNESPGGRLLSHCILPLCSEQDLPLALMIGVKRHVNPCLGLAGDSVGKADIKAIESLCAEYPHIRFLVSMLSRENQHELCVTARKFPNLLPFGCWWFSSNLLLQWEITNMRLDMLGPSFIPQHSDARVLEQLIYKWHNARNVLSEALITRYITLIEAGWTITRTDIERDVSRLLSDNFWSFINKTPSEIRD